MFDRLIEREGGYVNNPNDPGGETKYGISKRSYPHVDIPNLTKEQAKDIYRQDFYLKTRIYLLPDDLHEVVLDWAVHSGPVIAIKELQRLSGAKAVDGVIGSDTLASLAGWDHERLVELYLGQRLRFMARLIRTEPRLAQFAVGWVNRVLSLMGV